MLTKYPIQSLGARLKKERKRLGLTQAQFASKVGVGRLNVMRNELGERCPDADYLLSCQKIGVNIFFVLNGSTEEKLDFARMESSVKFLLEILRDLDDNVDVKTLTSAVIQFYSSTSKDGLEQAASTITEFNEINTN
jgi:transcriptional regulator with XRE-family HTH domain